MTPAKYKLAAALATVLVVIAIAWRVISAWNASYIAETEAPPCQKCSTFYSSTEIPTITLYELENNLEKFKGKVVRIRALFYHDAGQVNLYDDRGKLHAGLSNSFESCAGTRKALTIYSGFATWYDSAAHVVVVGSVGHLENLTLFEDDAGFNIMCLEKVEPDGSGLRERVKYTEGELFGLNRR